MNQAEINCFVKVSARDAIYCGEKPADRWHPNSWPDFEPDESETIEINGHKITLDGTELTIDGDPISPPELARRHLPLHPGTFASRIYEGMPLERAVLPVGHPEIVQMTQAGSVRGSRRRTSPDAEKALLHGAAKEEMKPKPVRVNNHFLRLALV